MLMMSSWVTLRRVPLAFELEAHPLSEPEVHQPRGDERLAVEGVLAQAVVEERAGRADRGRSS
jgi:hypothetical protein